MHYTIIAHEYNVLTKKMWYKILPDNKCADFISRHPSVDAHVYYEITGERYLYITEKYATLLGIAGAVSRDSHSRQVTKTVVSSV